MCTTYGAFPVTSLICACGSSGVCRSRHKHGLGHGHGQIKRPSPYVDTRKNQLRTNRLLVSTTVHCFRHVRYVAIVASSRPSIHVHPAVNPPTHAALSLTSLYWLFGNKEQSSHTRHKTLRSGLRRSTYFTT